jgi:hypothetical protein
MQVVFMKETTNMKKLNLSLAFLALAAMSVNAQTSVNSQPVGYVNVKIIAGTGSSKKLSYISLPLLDKGFSITGKTQGTITGVTSTTITDSTAGWTAGALSAPATPYLIQIKSGTALGRIFHIASNATTGGAVGALASANTATSVTISTLDTGSGISDLVAAGVAVGDSYEIYGCDTLSSALGSPSTTGIVSGSSAGVADTVVVVVNGAASTYFHNGTRWTKVFAGNPDASNAPLLPNLGFSYSRLGNTDIVLSPVGSVPTIARKVQIKNAGLTLLSVYYPADATLASLGLQNTPGWTGNTSSALADKVVLVSSTGSASTYWYTGVRWQKVFAGSPAADTTVVPAGAMVYINKIGAATGFSTFTQALPYTL